MAKLYDLPSGDVVLKDGTRRVWSTDGRPVNLLPEAMWMQGAMTVAFPDFVKRNAYLFSKQVSTSCISWTTIIPGEWRASASGVYNLADQVIGTMPDGCNFADIRVTLNRTVDPTPLTGFPVRNMVPTQQTFLPGGACLAEFTWAWKRLFWIEVMGLDLVLRRKQSVWDFGADTQPWTTIYDGAGGFQNGWTHGGGSNSARGLVVAPIQSKVPHSGNINKQRGGSNQCSLVDNNNFASTWTGSFLIRPGYIVRPNP